MRETMPGRRPDDGRLVDPDEGASVTATIDVLYVDADATRREATRQAITDRRNSISMASVASVEAALDVATDDIDCVVLDPEGLDGPVERLLARLDCPVIVYTDRDPAALDGEV